MNMNKTDKQNNNEALEELKKELTDVMKKIPRSEIELFLDFMENVWKKLFVIEKNQKPIDIHFVIRYIDKRMKKTRNKQHQAFWAEIFKMLLEAIEKLERI